MNIIIFEDNNTRYLRPFTINHASFEVRCGAFRNIERYTFLDDIDKITLIVRDSLKDIIQERYPTFNVNPEIVPKGVCINGTFIINKEKFNIIKNLENYSYKGKLISFYSNKDFQLNNFLSYIKDASLVTKEVNINNISYLWDALQYSKDCIIHDFKYFKNQNNFKLDSSAVTNNLENIYFGENSIIKGGALLDASRGPIIIDQYAVVGNGAVIEGPVYVGKNTVISPRAIIKQNTSIGPMCKVGGEISSSIIHAYSNKVHEGFLGNSYIGEWVNIGAGTNNSNLKNNYSTVKFDFGDGEFDTKEQFLGTMIGDYTRLGILTMLNTGTYIGFGSNVFGGNFQKKFIDSFSWGDDKQVDLEKLILTIKKMKDRRKQVLSETEINFIKKLYS